MALGERVGPGDVAVEAHLDAGCAQQRDAVAVDLAGDRQVALPEACLAAPREVRVGQHHAAARRGDVATDRPPVGREPEPLRESIDAGGWGPSGPGACAQPIRCARFRPLPMSATSPRKAYRSSSSIGRIHAAPAHHAGRVPAAVSSPRRSL